VPIDRRIRQAEPGAKKRPGQNEQGGGVDWAKLLAENRVDLSPERAQALQDQLGNQALQHLLQLQEKQGGEEEETEIEDGQSTADLEVEADEGQSPAASPRMLPRVAGLGQKGGAGGVNILHGGDPPDDPADSPDASDQNYTPSRGEIANATLIAALAQRGLIDKNSVTARQKQLAKRAAAITPDPFGVFLSPLREALQTREDLMGPDFPKALQKASVAGIWSTTSGWSNTARGAGALLNGPIGAMCSPDSPAESLLRIAAILELALYDPEDSRRPIAVIAVSDTPRALALQTAAKLGSPVPSAAKLFRQVVGDPKSAARSLTWNSVDERVHALTLAVRPSAAPHIIALPVSAQEPVNNAPQKSSALRAADDALRAILGEDPPTPKDEHEQPNITQKNVERLLGFAATAQIELCAAALAAYHPDAQDDIDATLVQIAREFRREGTTLVRWFHSEPQHGVTHQLGNACARLNTLRDDGIARLAGALPQPMSVKQSDKNTQWRPILESLKQGQYETSLNLLETNAPNQDLEPLKVLIANCINDVEEESDHQSGVALAAMGRTLGCWHLAGAGACIRANQLELIHGKLDALKSLLQFSEILALHSEKSALDMIIRRIEELRANWGETLFNPLFETAMSTLKNERAP